MRRFVFSLERVLKHKERRERLADQAHRRALAVLRSREEAAARSREQLDQAGADLARRADGLAQVSMWLAHYRNMERLTRLLAAADADVREAAQQVAVAKESCRQATRDAEVLRQLRHRQHELHWQAEAKEEQRALDEQGLRRWLQPETDVAHSREGES